MLCQELNWRGDYCCVPLCQFVWSERGERTFGINKVSFHLFPNDATIRKEWILKIRRDPGVKFVITKCTKVCSEHFVADDFVDPFPELPTLRACLHNHAVSSVFPWPAKITQEQTSFTSIKAAESFQEYPSGTKQCLAELTVDDNPCGKEGNCNENDSDADLSVLDQEIDTDLSVQDKDNEIEKLRLQVRLQYELEEAKKETSRALFRLENFRDNDYLVKYYTGFQIMQL